MIALYQKKINKHAKHIYATLDIGKWNSNIDTPYCFYYNWADQIYGIKFKNCLDEEHVSFLQKNPQIKIIYDFLGEPILESLIDEIVDTFDDWKLHPNQLIVIVNNILQREFVEKRFKNNEIGIVEYDFDIANLKLPDINREIERKKFAVMTRLHRPWRSYIVCRLREQNILDNFHYSFIGCINDMTDMFDKVHTENLDITTILVEGKFKEEYVREKIKSDLTDICDYNLIPSVIEFIDRCPHYIEKENFNNENECPQELLCSDVHLIIENGFFDIRESKHTTRSPEIGEKTWKTILSMKPFLVYSDSGFLKNFRNLGFKTFHPFIDESYDNEQDPKLRAEMIISEIERINLLSIEDFQDLLEKCEENTRHNYNVFKKIKENTVEFSKINFYDI